MLVQDAALYPAVDERECPISVVMPAFNEADRIEASVAETVAELERHWNDFEVIVVDDGSSDATFALSEKAMRDHPGRVKVVRMYSNVGKGGALIAGAWYAKGRVVALLDSDLDIAPSHLPVYSREMDETLADVLVGSKWHPSSIVACPWHRRFISRAYYAVVQLLFRLPVRDTQTGIKLYRRSVCEDVFPRLLVKRFAFDLELLAVARERGFRLREMPVEVVSRRLASRLNFEAGVRSIIDTMAIFFRLNIARYYACIRPRWAAHRPDALVLECEPVHTRVSAS